MQINPHRLALNSASIIKQNAEAKQKSESETSAIQIELATWRQNPTTAKMLAELKGIVKELQISACRQSIVLEERQLRGLLTEIETLRKTINKLETGNYE